MNIVALGDSFTRGDELTDCNDAWPSQLAGMLGGVVDNRAVSAGSSRRVVNTAMDCILGNSADLLVIGWPNPGRTEFADDVGRFDLWPGMHPATVGSAQPWRLQLSRYYNQYHNDDYIYQQYLLSVIALQSFIKQHQTACAMTVTWRTNHYAVTAGPANQQLEDHVDWSMFVEGRNGCMEEWTRDCPHGPGKHFLTQGHLRVATKFYQHITK